LLLRGEISSQSSVDLPLSCVPHGFKRHALAGLVQRKLAAAEREEVMAGGKAVEVVRIRITAAGRRAIGAG
jgi:hypothetical protein